MAHWWERRGGDEEASAGMVGNVVLGTDGTHPTATLSLSLAHTISYVPKLFGIYHTRTCGQACKPRFRHSVRNETATYR